MKIEPLFFYCQAVVTISSSRKKLSFILAGLLALNCCFGQTDSSIVLSRPIADISHPNKGRLWTVGAINVIGYGGSLILLNSAWYSGYAKTSFHTFNDSKEWLQVDKVGHGWTAYNAGRVSAAMWRWAGLPQKKAAWVGALTSTAFLTGIEFLDAHSSKWGWSWSDIAANFVGAGIFVAQETGWREQRIQYKFSFHRNLYYYKIITFIYLYK